MTYQLQLPMLDEESAENEHGTELLLQVSGAIGLIPNLESVMANCPALLDTYLYADEQFRYNSGLSEKQQQIVYLTVSVVNDCHYCVPAHKYFGRKLGNLNHDQVNAICSNQPLQDSKLQTLVDLTREIVQERGWVSDDKAQAFFDAGFNKQQLLSIILAVGTKTLSNYMNHIAQTPVDDTFLEE